MDMVLDRFPRLTEPELNDLLRATDELQAHVIEDANEILCKSSRSTLPRLGWCSDRAFSRTRIISWVTVEAYAFFRKRLQLIGLTKKQFVFTQYSWLPPSRCHPEWSELVDPNLGEAASTLVLQRIDGIVSDALDQANLFLLYGPPGTAKTALAQGLAQKLSWELITLSPSDFVVDSLDQIEHRSRELFVHMTNVEQCVILFDEMDTLLRDRETLGVSSPGMMIEFVVPALLPKLQQFRDHIVGRQLAAFFVTNFYERLDGAISRAGRLDHHLLILPYTHEARCEVGARILGKRIKNKKHLAAACQELAEVLDPFPCNLTYRDVEWICNALLNGRQGRAEIGERRADMGISPTVYSPKKRRGAFRELFAFMTRYRSQPLGPGAASASTHQIAAYFNDCASACPVHSDFFSTWANHLQDTIQS